MNDQSNARMLHQHHPILVRRFLDELTKALFTFVVPKLPTSDEITVKEEVRALIERLIKTVEPSARLLSFGSSCNSFGLKDADMDLVVLIDDPNAALEPSHFVQMIGDLLERETNFVVKPLPRARIPIIKLELAPAQALPFGVKCDIGIENRLAIENTRLLLTYATIDPARVRTLVLFIKVWAKERRINHPYSGTLSSYGFTLMVLYFLVHVKQPPVLPNLQRIAPVRPVVDDQFMLEGRNVYFFDDVALLRQEWSSVNFEPVGELLLDFFRFYSHDFQYNTSVMSLRAGQLTKESKGWVNDIDVGGLNEQARDRNRLCIEDPFEVSYNVARTVTKDGLYTIRGEFMRATRILTSKHERAELALEELCRKRTDELDRAPRSSSPSPRSVSASRGGFTSAPNGTGWRSHSHAPLNRYNAPPHIESPLGRRPRMSEGDTGASGSHAFSADWTSPPSFPGAQGPDFSNLAFDPSMRGRDIGNPSSYRQPNRRSTSAMEGGSGSISAPLSPHRMYAQLELGKGPQPPQPHWPAAGASDYAHQAHGAPVPVPSRGQSLGIANSHSSNSTVPSRSPSQAGRARDSALGPEVPGARSQNSQRPQASETLSPLPVFAPFSPPEPSILRSMGPNAGMMHVQSNGQGSSTSMATGTGTAVGGKTTRRPGGSAAGTGEDLTSFISPSTLLSPEAVHAGLPKVESEGRRGVQGEGAQELEMEFAKMGLNGEEASEGKGNQ